MKWMSITDEGRGRTETVSLQHLSLPYTQYLNDSYSQQHQAKISSKYSEFYVHLLAKVNQLLS